MRFNITYNDVICLLIIIFFFQITPLGKFINVQEGQFSDQFFSASMDGTIKLWDLDSTPIPRIIKKNSTNTSIKHPEKLNNYRSPLSIYNNRLKPSYTVFTHILIKYQVLTC